MTNTEIKIMKAALKESGHYIDINAGIVYVTKDFEKKSQIYGTRECKILDQILSQFSTLKIEVYAPKRAAKITFEMMELFICKMPNAEVNYREYQMIKLKSRSSARSSFKYVSDWFNEKFPHYNELTATDENGNVVWDALKLYQEAEAAAKAARQEAEKKENNIVEMPMQAIGA